MQPQQTKLAGSPTGMHSARADEPADWRWLVRKIREAGTSSVRASSDWQWVTFRRPATDGEVCQIVRLPVDGKFTVTRYDTRAYTCVIIGDYADAQSALNVALG
jgi:hypothetical protein